MRAVVFGLDPNPETLSTSGLNLAGVTINAGNQLALISSAGNFIVDTGFTVPSNPDALLATIGGNDITITTGSITNPGAMATTRTNARAGSRRDGIRCVVAQHSP